jgi:hypothetical protein
VFGDITSHGSITANVTLHSLGSIVSDYNITAGGSIYSQNTTVTQGFYGSFMILASAATIPQITASNVYAINLFGNIQAPSDRNLKEQFTRIDDAEVLSHVTTMPITRWRYKSDTNTAHIGPMAQDFYAAFNVGADDKHIPLLDEGGVALAAIQGLNEKVEAGSQKSEIRIQNLEAENADLKQRLEALEKIVLNQKPN